MTGPEAIRAMEGRVGCAPLLVLAWLAAFVLLAWLASGCTAAPAPTGDPYSAIAAAQAEKHAAEARLQVAEAALQATQAAVQAVQARANYVEQQRLTVERQATLGAQATAGAYEATAQAQMHQATEIELDAIRATATQASVSSLATAIRSTQDGRMRATETQLAVYARQAQATLDYRAAVAASEREQVSADVRAMMGQATCIIAPFLAAMLLFYAGRLAYRFALVEIEKRRIRATVLEARDGTMFIRQLSPGRYSAELVREQERYRPRPNLSESELDAAPVVSPGGVTVTYPVRQAVVAPSPEQKAAMRVIARTIEASGEDATTLIPAAQFTSAATWQLAVDALRAAGAVTVSARGTEIAGEWGSARALHADVQSGRLPLPSPTQVGQNVGVEYAGMERNDWNGTE